ncbi:SAM-dependent methyltransferase [Bradyrhizobium sp. USDA 3397]
MSQNMIERAKADTADAGISYCIANLDSLELLAGSFDLAYSALTFHYVQDFPRLTRVLRKALIVGGDLVFTIEHPIFMAATNPHWISDEEGRKTWPVNGYALEGERRTDWFAKGVLKYHRTIGTTLNTLIDGGFQILRVKEFAPTSEQIQQMPQLAEELERPMMLLVSASV